MFGVGFFREYLDARRTRARYGPQTAEPGARNGNGGGATRRRRLSNPSRLAVGKGGTGRVEHRNGMYTGCATQFSDQSVNLRSLSFDVFESIPDGECHGARE